MRTSTVIATLALASGALAYPRFSPGQIADNMKRQAAVSQCNAGNQTARKFILPDVPVDTASHPRPDADHPYIAPGPKDARGPCPALNTLANHGYIPRAGFAKSEELIMGVMEGFNMEHDFASFLVSFATMARGNSNTAMLSIGFQVDDIPPVPGCFDGPVAGGLATHGRFEGDVSLSRVGAHTGDAVNFQDDRFDLLLQYVGAYGDDGPDGKHTVLNDKMMMEYKRDTTILEQTQDKYFTNHIGRQNSAYSEVGFVMNLLANGANNSTISGKELGTFMRNQTFPPNYFRRAAPAGLEILSGTAGRVRNAYPFPPGYNDGQGNYVEDVFAEPVTADNFLCQAYQGLAQGELHRELMNTTGIWKENVMTMLDAMYKPFHDYAKCPTQYFPEGPACTIDYVMVEGVLTANEYSSGC